MGACGQRWETLPDTLTFALFLVVPAAETAGDVGANRIVTILWFGYRPVNVVIFCKHASKLPGIRCRPRQSPLTSIKIRLPIFLYPLSFRKTRHITNQRQYFDFFLKCEELISGKFV